MHLAAGLNEFLKSAQRTPVAFFLDGRFGKFSQILQTEKGYWSVDSGQTKEEFEHHLDENYKHLLPWDNRVNFDQQTVDIFNWHFPLQLLAEAARKSKRSRLSTTKFGSRCVDPSNPAQER